MTHSLQVWDQQSVSLPIPQAAHRMADQFAHYHPHDRREQVRLNTLAVWVMNDYFQLLGIPTDLNSSDSWNPYLQLASNSADLALPGLGRVECRAITEVTTSCPIPAEVWHDRIGYGVLHIDEAQQTATLLGFVLRAEREELPLRELRSPESFLDHLASLKQATPAMTPQIPLRVAIGQWLDGLADAGWSTIESLLPLNPAYAFRATSPDAPTLDIQRAKIVNLPGIDVVITLTVEAPESSAVETRLRVKVSAIDRPTLPSGVELTILDESEQVFLQAQSRESDTYIQLQFGGMSGEAFTVQLGLADERWMEHFVI